MTLDTIVAPATPPGRSALAVVRIDGPRAPAILTALGGDGQAAVRKAVLTQLGYDGSAIDECVAIRYAAPHSFTGNDLVELTLHGNPLLVRRVIEACLAEGARMAEPGEFTERAVLNGKIDLVQAESIADLINARTELQAKLSLSNLEGALSRKAAAVRQTLLDVISRLEAALDFAEEGYEFIARDEAHRRIVDAIRELDAMSDTYRRGHATTTGINAVILGRPNAGKSTLLNRLVGSDRAIVTPVPGTTRDIVRETIEIGGIPVTLSDTAGLRESEDLVEGIGIERARAAARAADVVLYLVDGVTGVTAEDERELAAITGLKVVIFTKADLAPRTDEVSISAVFDGGLDALMRRLDAVVQECFAAPEGALVNERQQAAVETAALALRDALGALEEGLDEQMVAADLHRGANALASLTGAITRDDIYAEIFSKFCIGK